MKTITVAALGELFAALRRRGYRVLGPTVRDQAIIYDELDGADDLPVGWTDQHNGGSYRLVRRDDAARFGFAVGPHSWKHFLYPPRTTLWRGRRTHEGFTIEEDKDDIVPMAFVGVRPCEIAAIEVQDRVFMQGEYVDPDYLKRRRNTFIVAVNCGEPGGTCFCASMGTGPGAGTGYDLVLTEVIHDDRHYFAVDAGSEEGAAVLGEVDHRPATPEERSRALAVVESAGERMGRSMETDDVRELLQSNHNHPRWDEVAARCLTCGNCTQVCPTCFCSTVEDITSLDGQRLERVRRWDSCFTLGHTYIHGGNVRPSGRSRYRQWMTHKLANWYDQFDSSGCVGCGRCITWCPVGIDITEEVRAIRDSGAQVASES